MSNLEVTEPTKAPSGIEALKVELQTFFEVRDAAKKQIESLKEYNDTIKMKILKVAEKFTEIEGAALEENKELYWEMRGKLYAESPDFTDEAIHSLAIAVKLNPSSVNAWNLLGECYCTKPDNIGLSIKCFSNALQVKRDVKTLLNLSIALRRRPQRTPQNIQDSLNYAQEAIGLDSHDHTAWMVLGNALVTSFFSPQPAGENSLKKALKAYELANHLAPGDFEVCCNMSATLRYVGRYEDALKTLKSCSTSVKIDQVKANEEYNKLKAWLLELSQLVEKRGKLRTSKLASLIKIAEDSCKKPAIRNTENRKSEDTSTSDTNTKQLKCGVVIFVIPSTGPLPLGVGLLEADYSVHVATVYNIVIGKAFKVGTVLSYTTDAAVNPIRFEIDGQMVNFTNVQIFDPSNLIVNGKKISSTSLSYSCVRLE